MISINSNKIPTLTYSLDRWKVSSIALSRNTPHKLLTRITTVEIPQNIKFFLAKDETTSRLDCKYAVKTDIDNAETSSKHI